MQGEIVLSANQLRSIIHAGLCNDRMWTEGCCHEIAKQSHSNGEISRVSFADRDARHSFKNGMKFMRSVLRNDIK